MATFEIKKNTAPENLDKPVGIESQTTEGKFAEVAADLIERSYPQILRDVLPAGILAEAADREARILFSKNKIMEGRSDAAEWLLRWKAKESPMILELRKRLEGVQESLKSLTEKEASALDHKDKLASDQELGLISPQDVASRSEAFDKLVALHRSYRTKALQEMRNIGETLQVALAHEIRIQNIEADASYPAKLKVNSDHGIAQAVETPLVLGNNPNAPDKSQREGRLSSKDADAEDDYTIQMVTNALNLEEGYGYTQTKDGFLVTGPDGARLDVDMQKLQEVLDGFNKSREAFQEEISH